MQVNVWESRQGKVLADRIWETSICFHSEAKSLNNLLFVGIGLCVQPLYLGEIAPTALRGTMGMGTSVFITAGILLGQVVGLR